MKTGAVLCCALVLMGSIGLVVFASERMEHRSIVITNDYEFTPENGVCSGSGTLIDPYVIAGWVIDAGYDDYGIRIHRTTRAFVIRDVEISGAAKSAIYLSYVENASIEDCVLDGNWVGITLNFCRFTQITGCQISHNTDGIHTYFSSTNIVLTNRFENNDTSIWLDASNQNELRGNYVSSSHMGVYLNLGSKNNLIVRNAFVDNLHNAYTDDPNAWDDGSAGNYWSSFGTLDRDENGIWDDPYRINSDGDQDNYPLVNHPLVPAEAPATCF